MLGPILVVLWLGRLFGWVGALATTACTIAAAAGMWMIPAKGAHGPPYTFILPPPLALGALLGLLIWYLWLGRSRKRM